MRHSEPTHRLYLSSDIREGVAIALDAAQMNYCLTVLRMQAGARLFLFNGRDGEWEAEVHTPSKRLAVVVPQSQTRAQTPKGRIRYASAPLKAARLDYMIQKAVEMGAATLEPVITARTQNRGLKRHKIEAHVIEAAEQCGILALPEIRDERPLAAWLAALAPATRLIVCDEGAGQDETLVPLPPDAEIAVLIGPEGGFDADERTRLRAHPGVMAISLGPRILRADTAAVAALTLVQAAYGDWPHAKT